MNPHIMYSTDNGLFTHPGNRSLKKKRKKGKRKKKVQKIEKGRTINLLLKHNLFEFKYKLA